MQINTAVFDMDGLLIDSEPCWQEAGIETLKELNVALTREQYHLTTGLRTKEWIAYWFDYFQIDPAFAKKAEDTILHKAIEKIKQKAEPMEGYDYILSFFREKKCRIGLATSSPVALIEVVVEKLGIRKYFDAWSSAENLPHSKPHPQVYMDCLDRLGSSPLHSLCFEDSFNGMISAKAARMKCVVIPAPELYAQPKWGAADLKLDSLLKFGNKELGELG
jgi:mannitol-1-/sugar-/sorbitol-6-/2-deoxyglucose-6-phosphatase